MMKKETKQDGNIDRGRTIEVLPGGEAEQILSVKGREEVYLEKRKGFIKLAMRKKFPVVVIYTIPAKLSTKFDFG